MLLISQSSLTLKFRPIAGKVDELRQRLEGAVVPFEQLKGVHFARIVLLPAKRKAGATQDTPAEMLIVTDFDGDTGLYLQRLIEVIGPSLDPFFRLCEGYVPGKWSEFILSHRIGVAANYVNTTGQTVARIKDEDELRQRLRQFIDSDPAAFRGRTPTEACDKLRAFADAECGDLTEKLYPAGRYPTSFHWIQAVFVGLVLLFLLPIWLPITLLALLGIRWLESRDPFQNTPPDPAHVRALAAQEDLTVSNQFSAYGFVKPGLLRLVTVKVVLFAAAFVIARFQTFRTLFGVKTIHFARWVFTSNETLFFASNYDGSQESYMDDFIDRIWWGLNGVFSNGMDYPPTEWLVFKGSRDEGAFKNFIRNHQILTQVWYAAYPHLTCADIANNTTICRGLLDKSSADTSWLRLI